MIYKRGCMYVYTRIRERVDEKYYNECGYNKKNCDG